MFQKSSDLDTEVYYSLKSSGYGFATLLLPGVEQLLDCSSSSSNNSLSLDEKLRWLRQFVPDTLAALPIALPAYASWTLEVKENIQFRNRSLVLKLTGTCYWFAACASMFLAHPHLKYVPRYMF